MPPEDEKNSFACVIGISCMVLLGGKGVTRKEGDLISGSTCECWENRSELSWASCGGLCKHRDK